MYAFTLYSALSSFAASAYLLLSLLILAQNPRQKPNQLFAFVGLTMAIWGIGEAMQRSAVDPNLAMFWAVYIVGFGAAMHPPVLMHFWFSFSSKTMSVAQRALLSLMYGGSALFTVIRFARPPALITGVEKEYWGYSTVGTPLYSLYTLYVAIAIGMVAFFAFRTASRSSGAVRKHAQYIGMGIAFALSLGVLTQIVAPQFGLRVPELSVIGSLVFVSFIAYAVYKYDLLVITAKIVAENILSAIEDFVIATDTDMKIAYVNTSAAAHLGYTERDLIGMPLSAILDSDFSTQSFSAIQHSLPVTNRPAFLVAKNGTRIPVSINATLMQEGSTPVGIDFALRDVTEFNRMLSELEEKRRELEASHQDLKDKVKELQDLNTFFVGRELKMVELKHKIEDLEKLSTDTSDKK